MAYTLAQVRTALARAMGRIVEGTATGGGLTTIVDTNGLAIYQTEDALEQALAYILEADGAAPEGDARWVEDYSLLTSTLTVASAYSAVVEAGDAYELYLAPLTLEEWNQCINQAIQEAWPDLYCLQMELLAANPLLDGWDLDEDQRHVQMVMLALSWGGAVPMPSLFRVPRSWWEVAYIGTSHHLLINQVYPGDARPAVFYRTRYAELEAADEETELYLSYLLPAARANVHALLAERSGAQATAAQHLQLLNYWREQAQTEAQRLRVLVEETRP